MSYKGGKRVEHIIIEVSLFNKLLNDVVRTAFDQTIYPRSLSSRRTIRNAPHFAKLAAVFLALFVRVLGVRVLDVLVLLVHGSVARLVLCFQIVVP